MPSGAPPPMQFAQLKFADQPKTNVGTQMQQLGKNLKAAGGDKLFQPTPPTVVPGAAVPGVQGPTSAGGPQGPMPLVAPGTPGPSVAPPAAAAPPVAPPTPPPAAGMPPIQLPQIIQAPPAVPGPSAATVAQSMAPQAQLDWLRRISGIGPNVPPPGFPGATALTGAGMLPSSPGFGAPPGMPQPPISQ
jgi:hypothetical protein